MKKKPSDIPKEKNNTNTFSSYYDAECVAFSGLARETDATVGTEGGRGEGRWSQFVIESVGGGAGMG